MIVQFRDGEREVLDYLATLMSSFETFKLTYDEALARVNQELVNDRVRREMDRVIQNHFKDQRR